MPVLRQEPGIFVDRIDIGCEREGDDIGLEAVDHGAGLLSGAAVRLLDGDGVASLGLPVGGEGGVVIDVKLAGRVVGHVEELDILGHGRAGERHGGEKGGENFHKTKRED